MSITTECPECQSRFHVQEDMAGRQMRCPACKEVFRVASFAAVPPPLPEPMKPAFEEPVRKKPAPVRQDTWSLIEDPASPPKKKPVQEFTWSDKKPLAPPPPTSTDSSSVEEIGLAVAERPRPAPVVVPPPVGRRRLFTIVGMVLFCLVGTLATAFYLKNYRKEAPARLWASAQEEFGKENYDQARRRYEEFAKNYGSDEKAAEASFLAELSGLNAVAYAPLSRKDPQPALERTSSAISNFTVKENRTWLAKDKYGPAVGKAVNRVIEDGVAYASETAKPDTLTSLQPVIAALQKVRGQRLALPDSIEVETPEGRVAWERLNASIRKLEERAKSILAWKDKLKSPTEAVLRQVREQATEAGLEGDAEFVKLANDAEASLLGAFAFNKIDPPKPGDKKEIKATRGIVFAVPLGAPAASMSATHSRRVQPFLLDGILYGLNADDGGLAWSRTLDTAGYQIGEDLETEATPTFLLLKRGPVSELVLLQRDSGDVVWSQSIPGRILGMPQRLHGKLLVSTAKSGDTQAAIHQIEAGTGDLSGSYTLGGLSGGRILADPATSFVYLLNEGKGVFGIEWPANGPPRDAFRIQDRTIPESTDTIDRLVRLPDDEKAAYWFRACRVNDRRVVCRMVPLREGERANVELAGDFTGLPMLVGDRVFAIQRSGTLEIHQIVAEPGVTERVRKAAEYPLPKEWRTDIASTDWVRPTETEAVFRTAKGLARVRFGFLDKGGPTAIFEDLKSAMDEGRAVAASRDGLYFLTRGAVAVSINPLDGRPRWRRSLGADIQQTVRWKDLAWLFDRSGRVFQLLPEQLSAETYTVTKSFADAVEGLQGSVHVLRGDNSLLQVAECRRGGEDLLIIRTFEGDHFDQAAVKLPAPLAGVPLLLDNELAIPLKDGKIHRAAAANGYALEQRPSWRSTADAVGEPLLRRMGGGRFLATNGDRQIQFWQWTGETFERAAPPRTMPIRIVDVTVAGDGRVLVLDETGALSLVGVTGAAAPEKAGQVNVAKDAWNATPRLLVEADGFFVLTEDSVSRFEPGKAVPVWERKQPGLMGEPTLAEGKLALWTNSGKRIVLNAKDGAVVTEAETGYLPRCQPLDWPGKGWILPLVDGTVRVVAP